MQCCFTAQSRQIGAYEPDRAPCETSCSAVVMWDEAVSHKAGLGLQ
jgi:hypothetical protein